MELKENFTLEEIKFIKRVSLKIINVEKWTAINGKERTRITSDNFYDFFDLLMMKFNYPNSEGYVGEMTLPKKDEEWELFKRFARVYCHSVHLYSIDYRGEGYIEDDNFEDEWQEFRYYYTEDKDGLRVFRLYGKLITKPELLVNKNGNVQCAYFEFLSSAKNGKRSTEKYKVKFFGNTVKQFCERFDAGSVYNFTAKRMPNGMYNEVFCSSYYSDSEGIPLNRFNAKEDNNLDQEEELFKERGRSHDEGR